MTSTSDTDGESIHVISDDAFLDVDLIEANDLINSATRLLDEVFSNRPMPPPITTTLSPRENAMQQVQRFLSSIREPESPQDDDVVFVEARSGNALPSNARTTAIVDLCTPVADEPTTTKRRGRRLASAVVVPQALFQGNSPPDCSNIPTKTRRVQPKREPGTAAKPVQIDDSDSSPVSGISSPPDSSGPKLICSVCMESVINRQPSSTSCGHIFCQKCILQAIRASSKCPLCNCRLRRTQVHRVYF